MSRYRKVDPRIWNDAKFRGLTDQGKLCFFFLLTHPHMTSIGAMRASIPGLAAEIGWTEKAFREAFAEASAKGMVKHDERASLTWLPKFLRYNQPESPNVVKGWGNALDLLPECELLTLVLSSSKAFAFALNKGFAEALPEVFAKAMPIQEQEQEQEQESKQQGRAASPRFDALACLVAEGVSEQAARDWLSLRKAKKAAPTETAIRGIQSEATKAGVSLQRALEVSCQRGWVGFEAKWLANVDGGKSGLFRLPAADDFENRNYGAGGRL